MSTSAHGEAGASSAGLKTTQLPNASAGAIFHAGIASGKFQGVMSADDADRLAGDLDLDAGPDRVELVAADAHRLAGEVLEDGAGAAGLADAVGQRLALLARQLPSQLLLARQDLGAGAVEDVEPLLRRSTPTIWRRPASRRRHRLLDVGRRPARELADDVAGRSKD